MKLRMFYILQYRKPIFWPKTFAKNRTVSEKCKWPKIGHECNIFKSVCFVPLYKLCWKLLISPCESCLVLQLQMPLCPCLDIIIKGKFEPKHQVLPAFNGIIMISIESRKSWCFGNLAPSLNFFQKKIVLYPRPPQN